MTQSSKNSVEIWADDLLGRSKDAEFLIDFLTRRIEERGVAGQTRSYVLNLDAGWGQGKTFFLKRLSQQLESANHLVAYVNAWEDDYAEDPLIAVMSGIDKIMASHFKAKSALRKSWLAAKRFGLEIVVTAGKQGAVNVAKRAFGGGVEEIKEILGRDPEDEPESKVRDGSGGGRPDATAKSVEKLLDGQAETILKNFRRGKKSIEKFRENLRLLLKAVAADGKLKTPLFVLIDELDRCRPTYAITLLERVKHLFDVDHAVFIVATDSGQLRHSINAVYGVNFDSGRYLLRFFDRTYLFEEPKLEAFVAKLFDEHVIDEAKLSSPPDNNHKEFFIGAMRYFRISLRDAEQCFDMLRSIVTIWPRRTTLELLYLLPLIISHQQGQTEVFGSLVRGLTDSIKSMVPDPVERWTVKFQDAYDPRTRPKISEQDVAALLQKMLNFAASPLPEIEYGNEHSGSIQWIRQRFQAEFRDLYGSSYSMQDPPYSVMRHYPEFVRNVGRLSQPTEDKA